MKMSWVNEELMRCNSLALLLSRQRFVLCLRVFMQVEQAVIVKMKIRTGCCCSTDHGGQNSVALHGAKCAVTTP